MTAEDLRRARAEHPITALQEQWSLSQRTIETELLPTVADLGVAVVAHSPTRHGALHRTVLSADDPASGNTTSVLDAIADAHGATAGQIALAWVHHRQRAHGVPVIPIPGGREPATCAPTSHS